MFEFKKIFALSSLNVLGGLLIILLYSLAAHKLDTVYYSVFVFFLMLAALLTSVLDLGISKVTSVACANEEINSINKYLATVNIVIVATLIILNTFSDLIINSIFENWLNLPLTPSINDFSYNFFLYMLFNVFGAQLFAISVGLGNIELIIATRFLITYLHSILSIAVLLLTIEGDVGEIFSFTMYFTKVVGIVWAAFYLYRKKSIKILSFDICLDSVTKYAYLYKDIGISSVLILSIKNIDRVLASKFLSLENFSIYETIYQILSRVNLISNSLVSTHFKSISNINESIRSLVVNCEAWFESRFMFIYIGLLVFFSFLIETSFKFSIDKNNFYNVVVILCVAYFINTRNLFMASISIMKLKSGVVKRNSILMFIVSLLSIPLLITGDLVNYALYVLLIQIASYLYYRLNIVEKDRSFVFSNLMNLCALLLAALYVYLSNVMYSDLSIKTINFVLLLISFYLVNNKWLKY